MHIEIKELKEIENQTPFLKAQVEFSSCGDENEYLVCVDLLEFVKSRNDDLRLFKEFVSVDSNCGSDLAWSVDWYEEMYRFLDKKKGYNQFQLNPDKVGHSNQNRIKYL